MYEEKDVYAMLGLEMPAEENSGAASDENTAGAVTGGGDKDGDGQQIAEAAQQVEEGENDDLDEDEQQRGEGEPGKPEQTREERARHAAARRKAEQDAAVQAALQQQKAEHDRQIAALIASMNLTDPATGKPVTTVEEYNALQKAQQARQLQKNLREGKLLPEDLQALIRSEMESKPEEKPAAAPESAKPDHDFRQKVEAELAEIEKLDPSVKSLRDILQMETGAAFQAAVNRGASFLDAFKLANFDRLQQAGREESAKRAQQAAINSQRSKGHMTASAQKGSGAEAVPADTLAMYRMLMPGKSDDEIAAHYNKHFKSMK